MDTEAAFVHPEEHVDSADAGIAHLSPSEQNTIETGLEVEEKVPRDELASVEHDDGGEEQSDSVEEEELEEVYEEGSDTDEMDEEEDEDDECNYIPEEEQGTSPLPPQSREVPSELRIASRCYSLSSLVPNEGLTAALRKLRGNPKAVLSLCTLATTHNILKCSHLHLTNRAVLIGDRYVRVNMLVHNAARDAILSKPTSALNMEFCTNTSTTHDPATCQQLHLLSKVVFVGVPGLRTGYFEAELHSNLGLTHTLAQSWDDQCGSWCRNGRSHVITTCKYLHYKRESRYSEKPKPPSRPQPLIANLTPKRPPQEGDNRHQRGGRGVADAEVVGEVAGGAAGGQVRPVAGWVVVVPHHQFRRACGHNLHRR